MWGFKSPLAHRPTDRVSGTNVTVTPTDEYGRTFDVVSSHF